MQESAIDMRDELARFESFSERAGGDDALVATDRPATMQINIGSVCNLTCTHCQVEAGPTRTELMSRKTMSDCLRVFADNTFQILDITGGAPEMNPNLEWLLCESEGLGHVMVRSNLCILDNPGYEHLIDTYVDKKVELICSMPCYSKDGVEDMRGKGVYDPCIRILKKLNERGYGSDPDLRLELAFNPGGPTLPPQQCELEGTYKEYLAEHHGIVFNDLYTLTNAPIGRFGKMLVRTGELDSYMDKLISTFNPATVGNLMCLNQISVGYDGRVYDCDGNQFIGLPVERWSNISELVGKPLEKRVVRTAAHCFACTAGHGSSCGGSLTSEGESGSCCCG